MLYTAVCHLMVSIFHFLTPAVVPLFSDTGELLLTQNSVMDKLYVVSDQPEEKMYLDMLTALAQVN